MKNKTRIILCLLVGAIAAAGIATVAYARANPKAADKEITVITESDAEAQETESTLGADSTVYVTPSGKKYHKTKECSSLKKSKTILEKTLAEATSDGYEPCSICVED